MEIITKIVGENKQKEVKYIKLTEERLLEAEVYLDRLERTEKILQDELLKIQVEKSELKKQGIETKVTEEKVVETVDEKVI